MDRFPNNRMDQFSNRMDQFSSSMNNDNILGEEGYPPGLTGMGNDGDIENYLTGDNFTFLHQKLSEATSLNASYAQRESHLKNCVEELKKEKQEINQKCESLLYEQQNAKNHQGLLQQKIDAETRQRFMYQDKYAAIEKDLKEEQQTRKELEQKLSALQTNLENADNFSKQIYGVADESAKQIETLKDEIRVLEEMLGVYKSSFIKVKKQNETLHSELDFVNYHLLELGNTFKDASSDIQAFKEENLKHESYINETLTRFKEITVHFGSMKDQYLMQQKELERYHDETGQKNNDIKEMKIQLDIKIKEIDELRKSSHLREAELSKTVEKLQDTLEGLVKFRQELEDKNKTSLEIIDNLREENIKLKAEGDSLKSILAVEKNYNSEKRMCVEKISDERNEWKQRYDGVLEKLDLSEKREEGLQMEMRKSDIEMNKLVEEINALRSAISSVEDDNKWISMERDDFAQKLSARGKEIESCIDEANNTEVCLKKRQGELMMLHNELASAKERNEKLEKEKCMLSQHLDESKKREEELQTKVKEFEDRVIKCQFLFIENDKKYAELLEKCDKFEKESRVDKTNINALTEEINHLKLTCQEYKLRNESLEDDLKETKDLLSNIVAENNKKAELNNENIRAISSDIKMELEKYKKYCDEKDEMITQLTTKVSEIEKSCEEKNMKLVEANGNISSLKARNEGLSNSVLQTSAEKQEYLNIIENFTKKEGVLRKEIEVKLLQVKDLEFLMNEQKREFEQYQMNVDTYDSIWENERNQALKDIQDELDREKIVFFNTSH